MDGDYSQYLSEIWGEHEQPLEDLNLDAFSGDRIRFLSGNPRIEHITGYVLLFRRHVNLNPVPESRSINAGSSKPFLSVVHEEQLPPTRGPRICCLAVPPDMAITHFCRFLGAYLDKIREIRLLLRRPIRCGEYEHAARARRQRPCRNFGGVSFLSVPSASEASSSERDACDTGDPSSSSAVALAFCSSSGAGATDVTGCCEVDGADKASTVCDDGGESSSDEEFASDVSCLRHMIILNFAKQDEADDFYMHFNGRPYSSFEPDEICRLLFVRDVMVTSKSEQLRSSASLNGLRNGAAQAAAAASDVAAAPSSVAAPGVSRPSQASGFGSLSGISSSSSSSSYAVSSSSTAKSSLSPKDGLACPKAGMGSYAAALLAPSTSAPDTKNPFGSSAVPTTAGGDPLSSKPVAIPKAQESVPSVPSLSTLPGRRDSASPSFSQVLLGNVSVSASSSVPVCAATQGESKRPPSAANSSKVLLSSTSPSKARMESLNVKKSISPHSISDSTGRKAGSPLPAASSSPLVKRGKGTPPRQQQGHQLGTGVLTEPSQKALEGRPFHEADRVKESVGSSEGPSDFGFVAVGVVKAKSTVTRSALTSPFSSEQVAAEMAAGDSSNAGTLGNCAAASPPRLTSGMSKDDSGPDNPPGFSKRPTETKSPSSPEERGDVSPTQAPSQGFSPGDVSLVPGLPLSSHLPVVLGAKRVEDAESSKEMGIQSSVAVQIQSGSREQCESTHTPALFARAEAPDAEEDTSMANSDDNTGNCSVVAAVVIAEASSVALSLATASFLGEVGEAGSTARAISRGDKFTSHSKLLNANQRQSTGGALRPEANHGERGSGREANHDLTIYDEGLSLSNTCPLETGDEDDSGGGGGTRQSMAPLTNSPAAPVAFGNQARLDSGSGSFLPFNLGGAGLDSLDLPSCPVCLEKLDSRSGGILTTVCNHVFHSGCLSKWEGSSCPVCRFRAHADPPSAQQNVCRVCGTSRNLWMCLVCGLVGCGRYEGGHAVRHWRETHHSYALGLEDNRVWDYLSDQYVYRLISSTTKSGGGAMVEVEAAAAAARGRRREEGPAAGLAELVGPGVQHKQSILRRLEVAAAGAPPLRTTACAAFSSSALDSSWMGDLRLKPRPGTGLPSMKRSTWLSDESPSFAAPVIPVVASAATKSLGHRPSTRSFKPLASTNACNVREGGAVMSTVIDQKGTMASGTSSSCSSLSILAGSNLSGAFTSKPFSTEHVVAALGSGIKSSSTPPYEGNSQSTLSGAPSPVRLQARILMVSPSVRVSGTAWSCSREQHAGNDSASVSSFSFAPVNSSMFPASYPPGAAGGVNNRFTSSLQQFQSEASRRPCSSSRHRATSDEIFPRPSIVSAQATFDAKSSQPYVPHSTSTFEYATSPPSPSFPSSLFALSQSLPTPSGSFSEFSATGNSRLRGFGRLSEFRGSGGTVASGSGGAASRSSSSSSSLQAAGLVSPPRLRRGEVVSATSRAAMGRGACVSSLEDPPLSGSSRQRVTPPESKSSPVREVRSEASLFSASQYEKLRSFGAARCGPAGGALQGNYVERRDMHEGGEANREYPAEQSMDVYQLGGASKGSGGIGLSWALGMGARHRASEAAEVNEDSLSDSESGDFVVRRTQRTTEIGHGLAHRRRWRHSIQGRTVTHTADETSGVPAKHGRRYCEESTESMSLMTLGQATLAGVVSTELDLLTERRCPEAADAQSSPLPASPPRTADPCVGRSRSDGEEFRGKTKKSVLASSSPLKARSKSGEEVGPYRVVGPAAPCELFFCDISSGVAACSHGTSPTAPSTHGRTNGTAHTPSTFHGSCEACPSSSSDLNSSLTSNDTSTVSKGMEHCDDRSSGTGTKRSIDMPLTSGMSPPEKDSIGDCGTIGNASSARAQMQAWRDESRRVVAVEGRSGGRGESVEPTPPIDGLSDEDLLSKVKAIMEPGTKSIGVGTSSDEIGRSTEERRLESKQSPRRPTGNEFNKVAPNLPSKEDVAFVSTDVLTRNGHLKETDGTKAPWSASPSFTGWSTTNATGTSDKNTKSGGWRLGRSTAKVFGGALELGENQAGTSDESDDESDFNMDLSDINSDNDSDLDPATLDKKPTAAATGHQEEGLFPLTSRGAFLVGAAAGGAEVCCNSPADEGTARFTARDREVRSAEWRRRAGMDASEAVGLYLEDMQRNEHLEERLNLQREYFLDLTRQMTQMADRRVLEILREFKETQRRARRSQRNVIKLERKLEFRTTQVHNLKTQQLQSQLHVNKLKAELQQLADSTAQKDATIADLEEQMKDVMFTLEAQDVISKEKVRVAAVAAAGAVVARIAAGGAIGQLTEAAVAAASAAVDDIVRGNVGTTAAAADAGGGKTKITSLSTRPAAQSLHIATNSLDTRESSLPLPSRPVTQGLSSATPPTGVGSVARRSESVADKLRQKIIERQQHQQQRREQEQARERQGTKEQEMVVGRLEKKERLQIGSRDDVEGEGLMSPEDRRDSLPGETAANCDKKKKKKKK